MPRTARKAPGGIVYHVLNRAVGRRKVFEEDEDYLLFEQAIAKALAAEPVKLLAYCVMPDHWHLLLKPRVDGQLGRFMQRLTMAHVRRWQERHHEVGYGHFYQGRFKSFPVQEDAHLLVVTRFIERNPLRNKLVRRAEAWRWSSLVHRLAPAGDDERPELPLAAWPVEQQADWLTSVNAPQNEAELAALQMSITKGRPFGAADWEQRMVKRLALESSQRGIGRPKKPTKAAKRPGTRT